MFAQDFNAAALARERHQRVAGQESLRVMDQVDLVAMHRMRACHQLEISEMRGEHNHALAGISGGDLIPIMETFVAHLVAQAGVKKSREADILGSALAEIYIRRAQNPAALLLVALRKCDGEIFHAD